MSQKNKLHEAVAIARANLAARHPETDSPHLSSATPAKSSPGSPTRKQGQFLAYLHEYMMCNHHNLAPTHAAFQKFFNLTPPSVNSMLIRLEQRGFIKRTPDQARGIQLVIAPNLIPPLERKFKFYPSSTFRPSTSSHRSLNTSSFLIAAHNRLSSSTRRKNNPLFPSIQYPPITPSEVWSLKYE